MLYAGALLNDTFSPKLAQIGLSATTGGRAVDLYDRGENAVRERKARPTALLDRAVDSGAKVAQKERDALFLMGLRGVVGGPILA